MIVISYPSINPSIRTVSGRKQVFCIARKRWVVLTPEEWVRQNFILYLVHVMHYPLSLISVERFAGGEVMSRFDIVIYKNGNPFMLVECKEMNVPLSNAVISQVLKYNIPVQASFIIIINGNSCFGWQVANGEFLEINSLPGW